MIRFLKSVAITLGLFVAVYAPAFALTALWRPHIEAAIPLVICISAGIAFALILLFARSANRISEFGFRSPSRKYVWLALALGVPSGLVAGWVTHVFPSLPPYDLSRLTPLMIVSYFVFGASIQEEIIFRGLLQTISHRALSGHLVVSRLSFGYSVIVVAVLFSLIHLPEGFVVALFALALGIVAGELRRRSASVVPAIIVHALFNGGSALFELPLRGGS